MTKPIAGDTDVTLRQRPRKDKIYLFLDIKVGGKHKQKTLGLFLEPGDSDSARSANKKTLALAEKIRKQTLYEVLNNYEDVVEHLESVKMLDYFDKIMATKTGSTYNSWRVCRAHILRFDPKIKNKSIVEISRDWVKDFVDYLDHKATVWCVDPRKRDTEPTGLSDGTKALVFQKLCSVFNTALKEGLIKTNPSVGVKRYKGENAEREFLTVEELRKLIQTPSPDEMLGSAFIFSCLTGLRWSDIVKLRWGEIQQLDGISRIVFRQQKTKKIEYLDISKQATEVLGPRHDDDTLVFDGLLNKTTARMAVKAWIKAAGINKNISFHCGRHTFAITMLSQGVDIYTLSKLMGHRCIETTQVYARILDQTKRDAVEKFPKIF